MDGQYEGLILEKLQQHGERLAALETAVAGIRGDVGAIRERLENGGHNHTVIKVSGAMSALAAAAAAVGKVLGWW